MYQDFFGLSAMPFNVTPDPRFLFLSATHQDALAHLMYGIEERKGFIVLTGEVGCGKTTLCRALLNRLDPACYDTVLILNPRISEEQLLYNIFHELGEAVEPSDHANLTARLNNVLLERISAGKDIVMIIDEAQNLSFGVLEQVRLLSNLETDEQKLLQIILMGQPELKERLREKRLRQLRQRVLVYFDLQRLSLADLQAYIEHRLKLAGGEGRVSFRAEAVRKIYKKTSGIPRLVNNLCDKALLSAYVRDSAEVAVRDVRRALRENRRLG